MGKLTFLRRVLELARPHWFRLGLGVACGFLAGLANPLLIVSVRLVIEVVFPQPGAPTLAEQLPRIGVLQQILQSIHIDGQLSRGAMLMVIATVPLAMLLRGLFTYLNIYLMHWVSIRTVADLRARLYEHLLGLSSSFFNRTSTGEIMARFQEVTMLQQTISNSLVVLIKEPITIISLTVVLLAQQPRMTLVALLIFPVTMIPFVIYRQKVRQNSAAIYKQMSGVNKLLHETFTAYRIIKAYNLEENLTKEFQKRARAVASYFMRVLRSAELPGPLIEFLGALGVAGFFVYIAFFHPTPTSPGAILQFVGSIFLMYPPIKALIRINNQLEQAKVATDAMFKILETKPTIVEPTHPVPLRASGSDIHFDGIDFSYGNKPVLRNINLTVPSGKLVALVGRSGAGKSTLVSLLLRFYDPQRGCIRIGDVDIRDVSTRDLRSQIAVVTQETILFNDTIGNNIRLGRPDATDAEVEQAARDAHAHEFIIEKPQGYNTVIGEKGALLSGGQRQRLAIARAIVKNAAILILDEATSSLDSELERAVQAALDQLMKGRTTICIAHRLSTIQKADVIVVLNRGQIVEMDKHDHLVRRGGHYQRLYELQFDAPREQVSERVNE